VGAAPCGQTNAKIVDGLNERERRGGSINGGGTDYDNDRGASRPCAPPTG
jgi:hypothetical protein